MQPPITYGDDLGRAGPVNLRQLEYLDALDRERHFGRAAAACHVSQPALSTAIARLEEELGLRLVEREPVVRPTEDGERLLPWARRTTASAAALRDEAARLRGALTGTLRMGVVPTAAAAVGAVTRALLHEHPAVSVRVRVLPAERIAADLRDHALDAGLLFVDDEPAGTAVVRLYRERLVLVTGSARIPADATEVPWARAAAEPLCLLTPEMEQRRIVDRALHRVGADVVPRVEADAIGVLLDAVAGGLSTIVGRPWLAGRVLPPGVRAVPLVRPVVAPWVGLATPAGPAVAPVAAALRASVRGVDVARELLGAEP
jgi:DNA-binding transcriptional LysR family regulator